MNIPKIKIYAKTSAILVIVVLGILIMIKAFTIAHTGMTALILVISLIFTLAVLSLPYLLICNTIEKITSSLPDIVFNSIALFVISAYGIYRVIYVVYYTSDAQSGIELFMIPVIQGIIYVILFLIYNMKNLKLK